MEDMHRGPLWDAREKGGGRRKEGGKAREHTRKTENELRIKTKITENAVMRVESWLGARSPGFQSLF